DLGQHGVGQGIGRELPGGEGRAHHLVQFHQLAPFLLAYRPGPIYLVGNVLWCRLADRPREKESPMTTAADTVTNRGYHAHIYYDPEKTRQTAERGCAVAQQNFQARLGGVRR